MLGNLNVQSNMPSNIKLIACQAAGTGWWRQTSKRDVRPNIGHRIPPPLPLLHPQFSCFYFKLVITTYFLQLQWHVAPMWTPGQCILYHHLFSLSHMARRSQWGRQTDSHQCLQPMGSWGRRIPAFTANGNFADRFRLCGSRQMSLSDAHALKVQSIQPQ